MMNTAQKIGVGCLLGGLGSVGLSMIPHDHDQGLVPELLLFEKGKQASQRAVQERNLSIIKVDEVLAIFIGQRSIGFAIE